MHVILTGPAVSPKGQTVGVVCPRTPYTSGMDTHDIGQTFVHGYGHDIVSDLVRIYIEYSYKTPIDRGLLYATLLKDQHHITSAGIEYIVTSMIDYCEDATDVHPTWHENIMQYFNHCTDLLSDGVMEMYTMFHADIFYPVMDMITLLKQNGLTLCPEELVIGLNYYKIYMTVLKDEYAYYEFDDKDDYPCAPFRLVIATPPTFAQLRRNVNWG